MKLKNLLLAFLAFQLFFTSCSKENDSPEPGTMVGLWTGTFTVSDGTTGVFYFSVKPDGKVLVENIYKGSQRIGNGTWNLNGTSFTCNATYVYGSPENIGTKTNHTATFSSDGTLTSGVWANTIPNTDTGTFTMTKVK